jgi:hypothetical protein
MNDRARLPFLVVLFSCPLSFSVIPSTPVSSDSDVDEDAGNEKMMMREKETVIK